MFVGFIRLVHPSSLISSSISVQPLTLAGSETEMPSLSSTYLVPAILLNPAFILHLINTFISHVIPPVPTVSVSPHPFMESLGPVPASKPYMDMHADDQLCWSYTAIMVFIQLLVFGRVQDNRVRRKSARAAKAAKAAKVEKAHKQKVADKERGPHIVDEHGSRMGCISEMLEELVARPCVSLRPAHSSSYATDVLKTVDERLGGNGAKRATECDESLTETSEEDNFM